MQDLATWHFGRLEIVATVRQVTGTWNAQHWIDQEMCWHRRKPHVYKLFLASLSGTIDVEPKAAALGIRPRVFCCQSITKLWRDVKSAYARSIWWSDWGCNNCSVREVSPCDLSDGRRLKGSLSSISFVIQSRPSKLRMQGPRNRWLLEKSVRSAVCIWIFDNVPTWNWLQSTPANWEWLWLWNTCPQDPETNNKGRRGHGNGRSICDKKHHQFTCSSAGGLPSNQELINVDLPFENFSLDFYTWHCDAKACHYAFKSQDTLWGVTCACWSTYKDTYVEDICSN